MLSYAGEQNATRLGYGNGDNGKSNTSDQVIVVAMITGAVSSVGAAISSIVAKIVEYKYNVKKYLYDKREESYKQFVEMI